MEVEALGSFGGVDHLHNAPVGGEEEKEGRAAGAKEETPNWDDVAPRIDAQMQTLADEQAAVKDEWDRLDKAVVERMKVENDVRTRLLKTDPYVGFAFQLQSMMAEVTALKAALVAAAQEEEQRRQKERDEEEEEEEQRKKGWSNIKQPPNFPPLEDGNNAFAFCNAFAYGLNMSGILPPQVEGAAYLPHLVYTIAKANAECIQATRIPKPGFQLIYRTERDSVCERVASYVQGDPWQIPPICRLVVEGKFTELFKCVFYKVPIA